MEYTQLKDLVDNMNEKAKEIKNHQTDVITDISTILEGMNEGNLPDKAYWITRDNGTEFSLVKEDLQSSYIGKYIESHTNSLLNEGNGEKCYEIDFEKGGLIKNISAKELIEIVKNFGEQEKEKTPTEIMEDFLEMAKMRLEIAPQVISGVTYEYQVRDLLTENLGLDVFKDKSELQEGMKKVLESQADEYLFTKLDEKFKGFLESKDKLHVYQEVEVPRIDYNCSEPQKQISKEWIEFAKTSNHMLEEYQLDMNEFAKEVKKELAICDMIANHINEVDYEKIAVEKVDFSNAIDMRNELMIDVVENKEVKMEAMLYLNDEQYHILANRTDFVNEIGKMNLDEFEEKFVSEGNQTLSVYAEVVEGKVESAYLLVDNHSYDVPLYEDEKQTLYKVLEQELNKEGSSIKNEIEKTLSFAGDEEKMADFKELSKERFLESYSYLTEREYDVTASEVQKREKDFVIENGILKNYKGNDEHVVVPEGVTTIGFNAFSDFNHCKGLKSVIIPEGVTNIGDRAFDGCKSLTSVTIPDSVTKIGKYAFDECESLTTIDIPENVTEIGSWAFANCSNMKSINIPDSVVHIGEYAFAYCEKLETISMPKGITEIEDGTFQNCRSLKSIEISEGTRVHPEAFDENISINIKEENKKVKVKNEIER